MTEYSFFWWTIPSMSIIMNKCRIRCCKSRFLQAEVFFFFCCSIEIFFCAMHHREAHRIHKHLIWDNPAYESMSIIFVCVCVCVRAMLDTALLQQHGLAIPARVINININTIQNMITWSNKSNSVLHNSTLYGNKANKNQLGCRNTKWKIWAG